MNSPTRLESDSLGPRSIPADALYGAHASRSRENFARFAPFPLPLPIYHAMALLKKACALANRELGDLPPDLADAIAAACDDVLSGTHDADLVLPIYQAGSGTSANMALNEVIANLANRALGQPLGTRSPVHPNDHVNRGQSTNNVFPSAAKVAVVQAAAEALRPAAAALADAFAAKADEFAPVLKAARTHLQDAVPITLGQEFHAYAAALRRDLDRLDAVLPRLCQLGIGGNAVGTGLNTRLAFRPAVLRHLQPLVPCAPAPFAIPDDPIAATQFLTDFADYSATLRAFALDLQVIANDLRLLASGPRTGIAEIALPAVEPGSSIMPGKVNPTQCEQLTMVAVQVLGNDAAIGVAASQGNLELNVFLPVCAYNFLQSSRLLAESVASFTERCVRGIRADRDRMARNVERSLMLATALSPHIGYEKAALAAQAAAQRGISLREACVELGFLSPEQFDEVVRPEQMV